MRLIGSRYNIRVEIIDDGQFPKPITCKNQGRNYTYPLIKSIFLLHIDGVRVVFYPKTVDLKYLLRLPKEKIDICVGAPTNEVIRQLNSRFPNLTWVVFEKITESKVEKNNVPQERIYPMKNHQNCVIAVRNKKIEFHQNRNGYIVRGPRSCIAFLSVNCMKENVKCEIADLRNKFKFNIAFWFLNSLEDVAQIEELAYVTDAKKNIAVLSSSKPSDLEKDKLKLENLIHAHERESEQYKKLQTLNNINKYRFNYENGESYDFKPGDFMPVKDIFSQSGVNVQHYRHKSTGKDIAMKFVCLPFSLYDKCEFKTTKNIQQEIDVCSQLHFSKHIIQLFGFALYKDHFIIMMEYMELSSYSLYKYFHKNEGKFPEEILGRIGVTIVEAINFLKTAKILHRDIKPQNILINASWQIKLADFGISKLTEDLYASSTAGTWPYMPPERFLSYDKGAINSVKYGVRSDIWSLGITLLEIAYGCLPYDINGENEIILENAEHPSTNINNFENDNEAELAETYNRAKDRGLNIGSLQDQVLNLTKEKILSKMDKITEKSTRDFILLCLQPLNDRPKVEELLGNDFFKQFNNDADPINYDIVKIQQEMVQSSQNNQLGYNCDYYIGDANNPTNEKMLQDAIFLHRNKNKNNLSRKLKLSFCYQGRSS